MRKRRDAGVDLDNALLDCMKIDVRNKSGRAKIPTLEEALQDELGKDDEDERRGDGWV